MAFAGGIALAGCDGSPSAPDGVRPQFDGRGKTTTTTTAAPAAPKDSTGTTQSTNGGGNPGDPCDPETYNGPYRCVPDPNSPSGYVIVT